MEKKERLAEEFELESEDQAFQEYVYITSVISMNYFLIADELSNLCDFESGLAVDIGCGLGDLAMAVARRYPQMKVKGIDISQKAINEAISRARQESLSNVDFQLADAHVLPFEDNSVDLVVSHGSIHHLRDASKTFSEIYRVLKPESLAHLTDLRRDAPQETVEAVAANLSPSQARGFTNSIKASYVPEELRDILFNLDLRDFCVSEQSFSRETIVRNKDKLRKSSMRSADYTKLSQTVVIKKEPDIA